MQPLYVPADARGKYLWGTQPFGPCRVSGCAEPFGAWHEFSENGRPVRTCGLHLPSSQIFVPFLGQQSKMYWSPARWVLGGGGAGGSKTYMGRNLWLKQYAIEKRRFAAGEIKHSQGHALFLRRTIPAVLQVVDQFKRLADRLSPNHHWDSKHRIATFPEAGGFKAQFGGCEETDSWETYWGSEYTLLVFDEAVQFLYTQIDQLDTRVRCGDPVLDKIRQTYYLTNPIAGGFDEARGIYTQEYFKQRFVDPAPPEQPVIVRTPLADGRVDEGIQQYIPSNVYDNPALMKSGTYEAEIRRRRPAIQKALLACSWEISEGAWLSEVWDPEVHVCKPFRIPKTWFRFKMADWGWAKRSACLWAAVDPEENIVIYRSLSTRLVTAKDFGLLIRQIEKQPLFINGIVVTEDEWNEVADCSNVAGPMDSELWAQHGETGPSRGEEIENAGCNFYRAEKNVDSACNQIIQRLLARSPNAQGQMVIPGLRFFDTCWTFIRNAAGEQQKTGPLVSLPKLPADEHKPDRYDTKADDHDADALGYGCVSRPFPGAVEIPRDPAQEAVYAHLRMKVHPPTNSPFPNWSGANGRPN